MSEILQLHYVYNMKDRFSGEDRDIGFGFPNDDGSAWTMEFFFYNAVTGELELTLTTADSSITYSPATHYFTLHFTATNTAQLPEYLSYVGRVTIATKKKVWMTGEVRFKPYSEA